MTMGTSPIPDTSYGVLFQDKPASELDEIAEQVKRLGYATLDAGYSVSELLQLSKAFDQTHSSYVHRWGEALLRRTNEIHTIRAPLIQGNPVFMRLATNQNLIEVLGKLIVGKFILNQQNGIINPPSETYNQGAWHRDLPYQHYISSSPLAVNALFCVDDFTLENGSTFVLPGTHKEISYPSESYIRRNALQLTAKAGQYVLLDCMLFHSGGLNRTDTARRAVNHVYTIPYLKQQIKLAGNIDTEPLTSTERDILGLNYQEPLSIASYLSSRDKGNIKM